MTETKEPTAINTESNIYLQQELELAGRISAALQNSTVLAQNITAAVKAVDKKARITGELAQLQNDKIELENKIEILKKNFGDSDSIEDVKNLKKLNTELEAVVEVLPILQKKLNYDSDVNRNIEDTKATARHNLFSTIAPFKEDLQASIDEKIKDILLTFDMFNKVFDRVRRNQEGIPSNLLSWDMFTRIIPNIDALEKLTDDPVKNMALAARYINIQKQTQSPNNGN
jgi:hypothetical protein